MQIEIKDLTQLKEAASKFVAATKNHKGCFAFYAPMGAGKTTLIKAICQEKGSEDVVTSPTFAIVNEYTDAMQQPIYHFDLYRIKSPQELIDMGADEYFYSGCPCFIEWPEIAKDILPDDTIMVSIEQKEDGSRTINIDTTTLS